MFELGTGLGEKNEFPVSGREIQGIQESLTNEKGSPFVWGREAKTC